MPTLANPLCPVHGVPACFCQFAARDDASDIDARAGMVKPKPACPAGHETAVRDTGGGFRRCGICGRIWKAKT